jgi:UDP-glucose 4-epimerase
MRVFVTGGAGFIGSHLCDALVQQGDEVAILDNLSTGSLNNISHLKGKIRVTQGDIRDSAVVESLAAESDLVLHMAAALGVDNILENPIESISTNFYGSEIVLNAALKFDKRVLIASTSEIYGKNSKQPLSESDNRVIGTPQKLRWTYSDAKALEEATAHFLYLTKKLKVTTIRFFNTVGPRQTGRYGMVIPRFVRAAIENKPLSIFGDGSQSRVFCHVLDVVGAIISLSKNDATIGEVFNIGGVEEISILDLANKILKLTHSKSKINFIPYTEANICKIEKFIGWRPTVTLDQIIFDVCEHTLKEI